MKRLLLITLPVFLGAQGGIIPLTLDPRPSPDYVSYHDWCLSHPETGSRYGGPSVTGRYRAGNLDASTGLIAVVVAENVEDELAADVARYAGDLTAKGYTIQTSTYSTAGTVEGLKEYLASLQASGIIGALLVGELPVAFYQVANDGDGNGHFTGFPYDFSEEFPCDLFLCDLDGEWSDDSTFNGMYSPLTPGSDGVYDSHAGARKPEIWVSRVDASHLVLLNPSGAYHTYFDRVHRYTQGEETYPSRGIFYNDDDWVGYFNEHKMDEVCDEVTTVDDKMTTCPEDYKVRLAEDGMYLTVLSHSDPWAHYFKKAAPQPYYDFYNWELVDAEAAYGFYNLFACSNCRWIETDCMGSVYQFSGKGLAVIGSAKAGGMIDFEVFNTSLGDEKSWGEAWMELTCYWMDYYPAFPNQDQYSRGWYMGICLLGDGTLTLGEQYPAAVTEPEPIAVEESCRMTVSSLTGGLAEVHLSLPHPGAVNLEVFDLAGRSAGCIHRGYLDAGRHSFAWDCATAPAGIYFVRLTTQGTGITRKVLIATE